MSILYELIEMVERDQAEIGLHADAVCMNQNTYDKLIRQLPDLGLLQLQILNGFEFFIDDSLYKGYVFSPN